MKFRIIQFLVLSGIYLFSTGCASPFVYSSKTSITNLNYAPPCEEKSNYIVLFFEGEPLNFNYRKIGIVEFSANYDAHDQAKLDYLKNEAWNNCANGIIKIQDDYSKGVAVQISTDELFLSLHDPQIDTSFAEYVKMDQEYLKQKSSNDNSSNEAISFLGFLGFVGLLMIPFLLDEDEG